MRYVFFVLWMLFGSIASAIAQVSIGIGLPGVSIGINVPLFPELVRVPGYPVYYAPQMNSNFFFYDGMYWVYQGDNWYASSWYNGPWGLVTPEYVPLFILRIPVRYYRAPPGYFYGWRQDAPPRWSERWGDQWAQQRSGWNRWNRSSVPAPAPLPLYQRQYSGDRYPRADQQPTLHSQNYRYQPRDPVVRQRYQEQGMRRAPAPSRQQPSVAPQPRSPRQQDIQRPAPPAPIQQRAPTMAPRAQPPQREGATVQDPRQRPQPGATRRDQPTPRSAQEERDRGQREEPAREPRR